jgi:hypothetical protein
MNLCLTLSIFIRNFFGRNCSIKSAPESLAEAAAGNPQPKDVLPRVRPTPSGRLERFFHRENNHLTLKDCQLTDEDVLNNRIASVEKNQ